jgi:multicomponent Na+:H+ antiporter subunit A
MNDANALIALTLATPLGMLLACLWPRVRQQMFWLLAAAPLPAGIAALAWRDQAPLWLGGAGLRVGFALDSPGAILLGVAALLWIAAGAWATTALRGRPERGRFAVCWLATWTGCAGVFLAADMLSFYFLLAVLSVGAAALVVQDGTADAWRAGAVYLGLALLAEALLLGGFVLAAGAIPGDSLLIRDAAIALADSPWRDATLGLLIAGFAIKAGLVPLHFWMPLAYGSAPLPVAAVLSGAVVKASLLGLIRFLPPDVALPVAGAALASAGLFAAYYGVVVGITQQRTPLVLASSSVS